MKNFFINLTKKQKIIISTVIIIFIIGVSYYAYSKENVQIDTSNLEVENNTSNNEQNEENNAKAQNIKVHVSGAVKQEGVYELLDNSRISDAIDKAGGFSDEAYTKEINLAYPLEDGMKIYVPTKAEIAEDEKNGELEYGSLDEQNSGSSKSKSKSKSNSSNSKTGTKSNSKSNSGSKVNINTATKEQLDTLPGVGPSTAEKIIQYRNENGKFKSIEDIKNVKGIGESKYSKIKDFITK